MAWYTAAQLSSLFKSFEFFFNCRKKTHRFLENLVKSSEDLQKSSENLGNCRKLSKTFQENFTTLENHRKIFLSIGIWTIFGKSRDLVQNAFKTFLTVFENFTKIF